YFGGLIPAAIGAFVWWVQNLRKKCFSRSKSNKPSNGDLHPADHNLEKLSYGMAKNDKVTMDHLAYQIVRRAEKLTNEQNNPHYNGCRANFIKSRRVYSLEVPRKCIQIIDILGEGNFGQVG